MTAPVEGQLERSRTGGRRAAGRRARGLPHRDRLRPRRRRRQRGGGPEDLRGEGPAGRPPAHRPPRRRRAAGRLGVDGSGHGARPRRRAAGPGRSRCCSTDVPTVLDAVTGRRPTVGVRVPDQPLALELLGAFGGGVAAPSANRFGKVSPTTAEHVRGDLGADVDLVLDGGPCAVGVESTIVDCTTDPPTLLRPGGVSVDRLVEVLGSPVRTEAVGPSRAPGMMASHYAPRCRVEVVDAVAVAEDRVAVLRSPGADRRPPRSFPRRRRLRPAPLRLAARRRRPRARRPGGGGARG